MAWHPLLQKQLRVLVFSESSNEVVAMNPNRAVFLQFSEAVTGYSSLELEGTGMVDIYQAVIEQALPASIVDTFYEAATSATAPTDLKQQASVITSEIVPSPLLWPIVSNLVSLWYLGTWNVLPDTWYTASGLPKPASGDLGSAVFQPSPNAYIEQLSYRTAGAHTPGAKPTGYGSWSIPPAF
jgi:hypothetical protein